MPEGDTIHAVARRMNAALAGREMEVAAAPNPRSPLHDRAAELCGATLVRAEAIGKHLLAHFSNDLVVHSHLGMTGRWSVRADGELVFQRPWLVLGGRAGSPRSGAARSCASRVRAEPAATRR